MQNEGVKILLYQIRAFGLEFIDFSKISKLIFGNFPTQLNYVELP